MNGYLKGSQAEIHVNGSDIDRNPYRKIKMRGLEPFKKEIIMQLNHEEKFSSDVLVIGGGGAGLRTIIAARATGARV